MFNDVWDEVYNKIDCEDVYNKIMMTLAFDSSEDHLASKKIMDLVGKEMIAFREELIKSKQPKDLRGLKKQIAPPEGVRRGKRSQNYEEELVDEGMELYEGDDDDLEENEVNNSDIDGENDGTDRQYDLPPIYTEVLKVPENSL